MHKICCQPMASASVKAGMEANLMSELGRVEIGSRSVFSCSEMLRMFRVGSVLLRVIDCCDFGNCLACKTSHVKLSVIPVAELQMLLLNGVTA